MGQKWAEPVGKPIMNVGRFDEVEPGIFWRIFSWRGLGGSNMARMWLSRRLPLGAWATVTEVSNNACGIPLAPMKLIFAPVSSYG